MTATYESYVVIMIRMDHFRMLGGEKKTMELINLLMLVKLVLNTSLEKVETYLVTIEKMHLKTYYLWRLPITPRLLLEGTQ